MSKRKPSCHTVAFIAAAFAAVCFVLTTRSLLTADESLQDGAITSGDASAPHTVPAAVPVRFVKDVTVAGRSMFDALPLPHRPLSCGSDALSLPPISSLYLPGTSESDVVPSLTEIAWQKKFLALLSNAKAPDAPSMPAGSPKGANGTKVRHRDPLTDIESMFSSNASETLRRKQRTPADGTESSGCRDAMCARRNAYLSFAVNVDATAVHLLLLSFARFHSACDAFFLFTDAPVVGAGPDITRLVAAGRIALLNASHYVSGPAGRLHATLGRYSAFLAWMDRIGLQQYDMVVHVDARDVLFQQNFFASVYHIAANGHPEAFKGVFTLAEESTFVEEGLSSQWVRDVLAAHLAAAAALLRRLAQSAVDDMPLSVMNSGIVGGHARAYRDYLALMCTMIAGLSRKAQDRYGVDQGVHIVLFTVGFARCRFPHPALLLSYRAGPARNAYLPPANISRDAFGRAVNCVRQPFALLHQIDRFPSLAADLRRPYRAWLRHAYADEQELSLSSRGPPRRPGPSAAAVLSPQQHAYMSDGKSAMLAELLATSRSGVFRYVRCRPIGEAGGGGASADGDRVLLLLVLCVRGLAIDAVEPFLRRALERLPPCTDITLLAAGGSGSALARLELDYDGRFESEAAVFSDRASPVRVARQWLQQRLAAHGEGGGLAVRSRVVLGLDVDLATLSVESLRMDGTPGVGLAPSGGVVARGAAADLVRSLAAALAPAASSVPAAASSLAASAGPLPPQDCAVWSKWWKGVCWTAAAAAMAKALPASPAASPLSVEPIAPLSAAAWQALHVLQQRHPLEGDVTTGGTFVTTVSNWAT